MRQRILHKACHRVLVDNGLVAAVGADRTQRGAVRRCQRDQQGLRGKRHGLVFRRRHALRLFHAIGLVPLADEVGDNLANNVAEHRLRDRGRKVIRNVAGRGLDVAGVYFGTRAAIIPVFLWLLLHDRHVSSVLGLIHCGGGLQGDGGVPVQRHRLLLLAFAAEAGRHAFQEVGVLRGPCHIHELVYHLGLAVQCKRLLVAALGTFADAHASEEARVLWRPCCSRCLVGDLLLLVTVERAQQCALISRGLLNRAAPPSRNGGGTRGRATLVAE
mmetsp:Transcript_81611/g.227276  ORF Transcript_81611/g.227276 Transcript_81611/m.227276 type:complete len:273 (+) Transcript_81611:647-1465(+)